MAWIYEGGCGAALGRVAAGSGVAAILRDARAKK